MPPMQVYTRQVGKLQASAINPRQDGASKRKPLGDITNKRQDTNDKLYSKDRSLKAGAPVKEILATQQSPLSISINPGDINCIWVRRRPDINDDRMKERSSH